MKKREIVSRVMAEVRPNASHSTRKASTVTMEIERRFSAKAYEFYLDQKDKIEPEIGLIGFELVAVYEDGTPEPVKDEVDEKLEEIIDTLDDVEEEPDDEIQEDLDYNAKSENFPNAEMED